MHSSFRYSYFFISLFISVSLHCQKKNGYALAFYADVLTNASVAEHRVLAHEKFKEGIEIAFKAENSFTNSFNEIPWIFVKYDPDSSFRFISWQVEKREEEFSYFNVFQKANGDYQFFGRNQKEIGARNKYSLADAYGALYLDLVPFDDYYLLSAYRRTGNKLAQRICDVLSFEGGEPVFGKSIFNKDENTLAGRGKKRVVLTYSSVARANLNINADDRIIIFDHIVSIPNKDNSKGGFLLVPDGSYEAYEYTDKDAWIYKEKLYDQVQATPLNQPLKSRGKD